MAHVLLVKACGKESSIVAHSHATLPACALQQNTANISSNGMLGRWQEAIKHGSGQGLGRIGAGRGKAVPTTWPHMGMILSPSSSEQF